MYFPILMYFPATSLLLSTALAQVTQCQGTESVALLLHFSLLCCPACSALSVLVLTRREQVKHFNLKSVASLVWEYDGS